MSYSASDLQNDIDQLLEELGYEIEGDDGDGWTWRFGGKAHSGPLPFDEATEATRAAMHDLVGCVDDILGTGRTVIERWEHGDLAASVRELAGALKMLDPSADRRDGGEQKAQRRQARLCRLIAEGLSFDDCVQAFGTRSLDEPRIRAAALAQDGETVTVMDHSVIREDLGQPGDAYALAWLRISNSTAQR